MKTAEEYTDIHLPDRYNGVDITDIKIRVADLLRDFADDHVRRALELANRAALIVQNDGTKCKAFGANRHESGGYISASIDKHSITNAYPKSKYIL